MAASRVKFAKTPAVEHDAAKKAKLDEVYGPVASNASLDHRRKWDREEYERKAQERLMAEAEQEARAKRKLVHTPDEQKVKREYLRAREYKTTPSAETGGYYCDVCDCVVKDSINFLDHINGKNHQRNMGMSMKIKRSTLEEVRQRFEFKKTQQEMSKKESEMRERLDDVKEEEARMADYKKTKRLEQRKKKQPEAEVQLDEEVAAAMGFGGFATSKK
ncbi:unnamed protein product [Gongylonema pulchrum]|uniref:Matrin-type domain-containing protein n=1 Tax=Gongylonema pulchrum TaxID=637853 RepID=A0A183E268_9BILA|nr:unnamed protein product [Gongylonema pulchrum]